jgi:hypothetical protein
MFLGDKSMEEFHEVLNQYHARSAKNQFGMEVASGNYYDLHNILCGTCRHVLGSIGDGDPANR